MKQENTKISICKGIAIILMVVGHAEAPDFLTRFIYLFHMPIFFITAGYFFRRATPVDAWQFVGKRFRGLYVPMVKWALLFLIFHNLFFDIGLLNEQFGNWEGGVTHPYTWAQGCQRFVNIVFAMGGYDEFWRLLVLPRPTHLKYPLHGRLQTLRRPLPAPPSRQPQGVAHHRHRRCLRRVPSGQRTESDERRAGRYP